ncbi:MAG: heavy-metal-associated domain-containing protein [Mycobacterium leprae]
MASVTRALKSVAGVGDVKVDLGKGEAVVQHEGANIDAMKDAITDAGYDVVGVTA